VTGETERRVESLFIEGLANKEISQRLDLSYRAVRWHTTNLHGQGSPRRSGRTERQIKTLLAEGLANAEIAERLYLSVRTVKWHCSNLYRKYGLYGVGSDRRLIVLLVKEKMFALTASAAAPSVSASVPEKINAHSAHQL
jgi:DNA-binding CsgD family transcriptional regulator